LQINPANARPDLHHFLSHYFKWLWLQIEGEGLGITIPNKTFFQQSPVENTIQTGVIFPIWQIKESKNFLAYAAPRMPSPHFNMLVY
jgi:hypothetical protein